MRYEDYDSLIMGNSGAVCYISDIETYELIHLTKAGMEMRRLESPEDYLGKKCYEILYDFDAPCPFCTNDYLCEGKEYYWEYYNESLQTWFSLTDNLIKVDGRQCRMEIAQDINVHKEKMNVLAHQLSLEEIILQCLNTLVSEKDVDKAFQTFLEYIGVYYHAERAYIFEFDLKRNITQNTYEWCMPGVSAEIDNLQSVPIEVISNWIRKFEKEGEFFITSLRDEIDMDSDAYRILAAQGIQSLLAAPLTIGDKIMGFLGVDNPAMNSDDLTLLKSMTGFVIEELEKRHMIAELEYISYTDMLTGLKNRNQYIRLLKEYDERTPDTLGVIFVDINGMKRINDTYGHNFGDYVIRQTASIMKAHLQGYLFRIGGDEFVGLCEDISRDDFQEKITKLREAYEEDEDCDVSIGCVWKEREVNINNQLLQADEMMYAEKQSYYHDVLNVGRVYSRTGFSSEVLREIEQGRFTVFYQPQVDIQTEDIIGAEALVRKQGDKGEVIPPDKFIPFYEAEGVISHLDIHVFEMSCATMKKWLEQGFVLHLSVNFSRITLMEPGIVSLIKEICSEYQVPTSHITIEVTESISKMDYNQLKNLVQELTGEGFTISLDDFGSRYSNLAILAFMDFDEIKFDRTLVNDLENNKKSQIVMRNSISMCRDLEKTSSIAEGIETEGQLGLLQNYKCNYGQGYYFSRPVPLEEFDRLLKEGLKKR